MAASLLFALLLAAAGPARLPPVDECAADASFVAFRAELAAAAARKDAAHVLAIAAEDIMVDFGGGHGREAFAAAWGLDRPGGSGLWAELEAMLRLGCTLSGGAETIAAVPSLLGQLSDDRDAFMTLLAVRPGAMLRAAPADDAPAIRRLDWDLLTLADKGGTEGWHAVVLEKGRKGYVRWEDVRSPLDHRALIKKRGGRWEMVALVAGD